MCRQAANIKTEFLFSWSEFFWKSFPRENFTFLTFFLFGMRGKNQFSLPEMEFDFLATSAPKLRTIVIALFLIKSSQWFSAVFLENKLKINMIEN